MRREPSIDSQGVKYQRAHASQMPGASGLCRLKESNSKKGGAKLNRKTNMLVPTSLNCTRFENFSALRCGDREMRLFEGSGRFWSILTDFSVSVDRSSTRRKMMGRY
jgi:hypothetical protein